MISADASVMDTITRRSAYVSTALHAALVALAFWPRGCGCSLVRTAPPVASASAAPLAPPASTARPPSAADAPLPPQRRLVLAPATRPPPPPLPKLGAGALPPMPADPVHLITPSNTDHAGDAIARGAGQAAAGHERLPGLTANGADLIAQLATKRTSNAEMDREGRTLKTTQEFLEGQLNRQIQERWRHLAAHLTEPRLVIELSVTTTGAVDAHLLTGSGNQELDQAIEAWLRSPDLRLPPIRPDVRYPFLVIIRR